MDILVDIGRQNRRFNILKNLATGICNDFQAKAARDGSTVLFSLDNGQLEQSFQLYLLRLRAFKRAAGMTESLANPIKIAAMTSLCLIDRPCIRSSLAESSIAVVYRHSWLALNAATCLLGLDAQSLAGNVRTELLQVLTILPWMAEERPEAIPDDDDFHLSFERRLTILTALYGALRRQVPITVP